LSGVWRGRAARKEVLRRLRPSPRLLRVVRCLLDLSGVLRPRDDCRPGYAKASSRASGNGWVFAIAAMAPGLVGGSIRTSRGGDRSAWRRELADLKHTARCPRPDRSIILPWP